MKIKKGVTHGNCGAIGRFFIGLNRCDRVGFAEQMLDVNLFQLFNTNLCAWFEYFSQMFGQIGIDRFDKR